MLRIRAYTILVLGHVFPFLPILLELKRRGHDVGLAVAAQDGAPREIGGIPIFEIDWKEGIFGNGPELRNSSISALKVLNFAKYGEPLANPLERLLQTELPDVLLIDPMMWGAMTVAEASGLSWASIAYEPRLFRGQGMDLRGPGLRPPASVLGRAWHRAYEIKQQHDEAPLLDTLNSARRARSLAELPRLSDLYLRPPLTIATTAEPFEYPRSDWPSAIRFVGPLSWEPPDAVPDWANLLDERPLVLFSGSSIPRPGSLRAWAEKALDVLSERDWQIIATLPTDNVSAQLPRNVRIVRFVPHSQLLPRASCVVCHGGMGIIQKSLSYGVPVVAIPTIYEFEAARRLEVSGAGVIVPASQLTGDRLLKAVDRAVVCRPAAERIARAFQSAGGPPAAADAIESLLSVKRVATASPVRG